MTTSIFHNNETEPEIAKNCQRFRKNIYSKLEVNNAILYMNLRKDGCKTKEARKFSQKSFCKLDTTLSNGPRNFKKLRVNSEASESFGGCLTITPRWRSNKREYNSLDILKKADPLMYKLENKTKNQEEKVKEEFKKKIKALLVYYKELNQKHSYSRMSRCHLYNTLKELNNEDKKEFLENKCFVQMEDDLKLYHFGEEALRRQKNSKKGENLIENMNAFPVMGNPENIHIERRNDSIEAFDSHFYLNPEDLIIKRMVNERDEQYKNFKQKTLVFEELEAQNNMIDSINNIESFVKDDLTLPFFHDRRIEKRKSSKLRNHSMESPNFHRLEARKKTILSLKNESKKMIEEEFNKTKYLLLQKRTSNYSSFNSRISRGISVFNSPEKKQLQRKISVGKVNAKVIKTFGKIYDPDKMLAKTSTNKISSKNLESIVNYRDNVKKNSQYRCGENTFSNSKTLSTTHNEDSLHFQRSKNTEKSFFFHNKEAIRKLEDFE